MAERRRGKVLRVTGSQAGPKKGLDPVSAYVRFRLEGLIGDEPGQIQAKDAAERMGVAESQVSQFRRGVHGLARRNYAAYAKFLGIRGEPAKAAESLVRDAGEWYGSLVGGTFPLLEEPAVQQAIDLVAQAEKVSPKVVKQLLVAYGNSRFLGRDAAFWVRALSEEMRYESALKRELAANEK